MDASPISSCTVRRTLYVPAVVNACDTFAPVAVVPSRKSHEYEAKGDAKRVLGRLPEASKFT